MNENVTVAQVAEVARTAIAIGDAQVARLEQRLARIEEAVRGEHRPVKFTDVRLGMRDAEVCLTCHVRLDMPEGWPEDDDTWPYPLVPAVWPCGAVRAFDSSGPERDEGVDDAGGDGEDDPDEYGVEDPPEHGQPMSSSISWPMRLSRSASQPRSS